MNSMHKVQPKLHHIKWPVPSVLAFSSTRQLISSTHILANQYISPFDSFNLGDHVGDIPDNVSKNRQILTNVCGEYTNIQWLKQVHGNTVLEIKAHSKTALIADAIFTQEKNIALAIMTADCLPILLVNQQGTEIAAIHGGWRSLSQDIIKNTLKKFKSNPEDLYAWLGPCISQRQFEVGNEVKQCFITKNNKFSLAFTKHFNKQKCYANLALIAQIQLNDFGVNNLEVKPHCTFERADEYYSYRRDGETGRMASLIMLQDKSANSS